MMAKRSAGKAKPKTLLWWIGLWATIWWAVTCGYCLLLFWQARRLYAMYSVGIQHTNFVSGWQRAISATYTSSSFLRGLLAIIVAVWVIVGLIWLVALKNRSISYKSALRDLFLTIRK